MTARGLLIALDYPPKGGGIARLLDAWTIDTDEMCWRVITATPGDSSARVMRTSRKGVLPAAVRMARDWLSDVNESAVVAGHPYLSGVAVAAARSAGTRSACIAHGTEVLPRMARHRLALFPLRFV